MLNFKKNSTTFCTSLLALLLSFVLFADATALSPLSNCSFSGGVYNLRHQSGIFWNCNSSLLTVGENYTVEFQIFFPSSDWEIFFGNQNSSTGVDILNMEASYNASFSGTVTSTYSFVLAEGFDQLALLVVNHGLYPRDITVSYVKFYATEGDDAMTKWISVGIGALLVTMVVILVVVIVKQRRDKVQHANRRIFFA
eukprot:TRINITY_DN4998_c0_g1_i1.p1 TRINITY_DN4998_c0_g1~~TRINITY_DN4998_c0_g1_i1.p1  ORF type:complete len:197 (-),score=42.45 TRINITY_DN4998_c0_g1_i1:160-750(-)